MFEGTPSTTLGTQTLFLNNSEFLHIILAIILNSSRYNGPRSSAFTARQTRKTQTRNRTHLFFLSQALHKHLETLLGMLLLRLKLQYTPPRRRHNYRCGCPHGDQHPRDDVRPLTRDQSCKAQGTKQSTTFQVRRELDSAKGWAAVRGIWGNVWRTAALYATET